jgi:hypothetical protein
MTLISLPSFLTDAWTRSHRNWLFAKVCKEKERFLQRIGTEELFAGHGTNEERRTNTLRQISAWMSFLQGSGGS